MSYLTCYPFAILPPAMHVRTDPPATPHGRFYGGALDFLEYAPTADDPIGVFNLTLTNVVVGSIYSVEVASTGEQVSVGTAADTTVAIPLFVYSLTDKNQLRIKVRKSSGSPFYQPFETQTTAVVGNQSIFVGQVRDDI